MMIRESLMCGRTVSEGRWSKIEVFNIEQLLRVYCKAYLERGGALCGDCLIANLLSLRRLKVFCFLFSHWYCFRQQIFIK